MTTVQWAMRYPGASSENKILYTMTPSRKAQTLMEASQIDSQSFVSPNLRILAIMHSAKAGKRCLLL